TAVNVVGYMELPSGYGGVSVPSDDPYSAAGRSETVAPQGAGGKLKLIDAKTLKEKKAIDLVVYCVDVWTEQKTSETCHSPSSAAP
ncbi:MAG: hypothetical protein AB2735_21640, partial [Candidatus Thiodiazotropha taylori]